MKAKAEPARDVIYADLDDEVTVLFEHIRKARRSFVVLVVPARAHILQSLVSLKILRHKSANLEKDITIATTDPVGRRLAAEAGFATAERIQVEGKRVTIEHFKPATRTEIEQVIQTGKSKSAKGFGRRILQITETAKKKVKQIAREDIPLANPTQGAKELWHKIAGGIEEAGEGGQQFVVRAPSRGLLSALIIAAVLLLVFIMYIAVPTATIYVTPRADPISKVVNVTLTDQIGAGPLTAGAHVIPSEFFDFTFSRDIRIGATGQIFEGESARGSATIFNRSPRDKFIVPSRFLSVRDQLIFRTERAVTIPKAIGDVLGSVEVTLIAAEKNDIKCDTINDPESCEGKFVGDYGNIEPAFFVMPAIPSLSPSLYWAESTEPFTGGVTDITKFVTEADIENVKETVTLEIINLAREELGKLVEQKNKLENRQLALLTDRQAFEVEIQSLVVPPDLAGSLQDDFSVAVSARVKGVAYESDDLRALLYNQLDTKVHPEKRLSKIDFEKASIRVEKLELDESFAKLAVGINGIEEFDLSEVSADGARLVEKIRARIIGKSVLEAEKYIRNLPEVNNAVISSWPFWARTVPELPENVSFKAR